MKPDRSNYELWIVDWMDGKLSAEEISILRGFLNANPDLKEEVSETGLPVLDKKDTAFMGKPGLKKTAGELPLSQVEFLSTAFLENDINTAQLNDLEESIRLNNESRLTFEKLQKTKLHPDLSITFTGKNKLKKNSPFTVAYGQSVAWAGLAAAAVLILFTLTFVKRNSATNTAGLSEIIKTSDTSAITPFIVRTLAYYSPDQKKEKIIDNNSETENKYESENILISSNNIENPVNNTEKASPREPLFIPVAPVSSMNSLSDYLQEPTIIAMNMADYQYQAEIEDDNSRLARFLARNFREKLLNEEDPAEDPLKTYEIAEAGIEGINRLLGWDMQLVRNTGEEGELKSLYFTSRLVKFNTPVKKEEPAL